jgi:hypothetical protein
MRVELDQVSQFDTVQTDSSVKTAMFPSSLVDYPSQFRGIVIDQPPTNDVSVHEVLSPAPHVLASEKKPNHTGVRRSRK